MRTIPFNWTTLYADHVTTIIFVPVTGWLPASDLKEARLVFDLHALMGNFKCRPAFQTANSTDETPTPSTTTVNLGTYTSTAKVDFPVDWKVLTSAIEGQQLIRFGFECLITEAGSPAMASVSGQVQAILSS